MTRLAMGYQEFRELVATDHRPITAQDPEMPLTNISTLLFIYPLATGVKTGTTPAADPSLVSSAAENECCVSVVLNAKENRFAVSIRTLEHGFAAYDRRDLIYQGSNRRGACALPPGGDGGSRGKGGRRQPRGWDSDVEREARVSEDLLGSARSRTKLGEVVVKADGERGPGRARSWPAGATTRPRCGSGCGIQSGDFRVEEGP
jgi:serine-type D-Ala-D-Ala carboxypeptidase (penicillin-binding protein 5/6)